MRSLIRHMLMLGNQGTTAWSPTYLLRDEFTTDEAAPLTSPRTCEPGPGTLTFAQADREYSISSGLLNSPQPSSAGWNKVGYYSSAISRAPGVAVLSQLRITSDYYMRIALGTATAINTSYFDNMEHGFYFNNGAILDIPFSELIAIGTWAAATNYIVAFVLRSAGAFYFIKGGAFSDWTLLFVDPVGATATLYFVGSSAYAPFTEDYLRAWQLPAPFNTDFGIATLNVDSPADATEYTGNADAIIDLTVTAPGSLDGDPTTRCGFYYRADADLTPAWHCYVAGDGTFNVDSIASDGTRTNRITVAAVIAGGNTRTLRVICAGTKHNAYTLSGTTWTKRGAEINVSLNDAVATIVPEIPGGWSAANLRSYPRTDAAYALLNQTVP